MEDSFVYGLVKIYGFEGILALKSVSISNARLNGVVYHENDEQKENRIFDIIFNIYRFILFLPTKKSGRFN